MLVILSACGSLEKSINRGEYDDVIRRYATTDPQKNDSEINYQIAEAFRKSNRLAEAVPFYEAAIDQGHDDETAVFHYARALKASRRCRDIP